MKKLLLFPIFVILLLTSPQVKGQLEVVGKTVAVSYVSQKGNANTTAGKNTEENPVTPVETSIDDAIPAPVIDGDIPIAVCDYGDVTLNELPIFNTEGFDNIYWFSTIDQQAGTGLSSDTIVQEDTNYYAFQAVDPDAEALLITVDILADIPNPYIDGDISIAVCENEDITLGELPVFNTDGFDGIYWYSTYDQQPGTELDTATIVFPGETYYAFQGIGEYADALEVTVDLMDVIPAPYIDGDIPIAVCENEDITLGELPVFNTDGFDGIYWFSTSDQQPGTELDPATIVEEGVYYYAFQGIGDCAEELLITVDLMDVIPAPYIDVDIPILDCEYNDTTLGDLPVFNTDGFNGIYWYSTDDQQAGTELDMNTIVQEGVNYYAFQGVGDCAEALLVSVYEMDAIPAPYIDGDNPIAVCEDEDVTLSELPVLNTDGFDGIYWFLTPDQQPGTELDLDTIVEEGVTYYAFQGVGDCAEALVVEVTLVSATEDTDGDGVVDCTEATDGTDLQDPCDYLPVHQDITSVSEAWNLLDCDNDSVNNGTELDEDTDVDGIFNVLDPDDDGDSIPTEVEAIVTKSTNAYLDTDGDGTPNYLDDDDDDDGTPTIDEDYNGDGDPTNDDTNNNGIPDYLDEEVTAGVNELAPMFFELYPNPVQNELTIRLKDDLSKHSLTITNIQGQVVFKSVLQNKDILTIDVSSFTTGVYLLNITSSRLSQTQKLIVE